MQGKESSSLRLQILNNQDFLIILLSLKNLTIQAFSRFPAIREIVGKSEFSHRGLSLEANRMIPREGEEEEREGRSRKPDSVRPDEAGRTIIFLAPAIPELPSAPKRFRVRLIPGLIPPKRNRTGDPDFALFCLAPRGVCLAPSVTLGAVSSYLAFSPLPHRSEAVCFLRHYPSTVACALRRPRFREARCLEESGLSSGAEPTKVGPRQRSSPTNLRWAELTRFGPGIQPVDPVSVSPPVPRPERPGRRPEAGLAPAESRPPG